MNPNRLTQLGVAMMRYLLANQGQGWILGAIIAQNIGCRAEEILEVAASIRDRIPDFPLLSKPWQGYQVSLAWDTNRQFQLPRVRSILTIERRTISGALDPLLRQHQLSGGRLLSAQEEMLTQFAQISLTRSTQDLERLEQALR